MAKTFIQRIAGVYIHLCTIPDLAKVPGDKMWAGKYPEEEEEMGSN